MFDFNNLGSSLNEYKPFSDNNNVKTKEFENSTLKRNDEYYVGLPWQENEIYKVPFNYPVALRILEKQILIITLKVKT